MAESYARAWFNRNWVEINWNLLVQRILLLIYEKSVLAVVFIQLYAFQEGPDEEQSYYRRLVFSIEQERSFVNHPVP